MRSELGGAKVYNYLKYKPWWRPLRGYALVYGQRATTYTGAISLSRLAARGGLERNINLLTLVLPRETEVS